MHGEALGLHKGEQQIEKFKSTLYCGEEEQIEKKFNK